MEEELKKIQDGFAADTAQGLDPQALRVKYLGRKGLVNDLFSRLAQMPAEDKAAWGRRLNELKNSLDQSLKEKMAAPAVFREALDLTLPGKGVIRGSSHVLSQVSRQICSIFEKLGFEVIEGPDIEDEWHNFTALNFPADHPSRDSFDTFFLDIPAVSVSAGRHLLRCHTSPNQIRVMEKNKPPMAVISPGRVYRPDEVDATHSFMFHQVEGFAVSRDINFSHLKGVLFHFAQGFFSAESRLRFRPHFFPFTEPSAEVDVSCFKCQNKRPEGKCSLCKGKGWIEILGCGMIHPNVLEFCGIDSAKFQGFAFGMGVDRIAMLKYGIDDIRLFTENDVRFLDQF
jgi:phenylalanyl-tRNA synthetase alpha chain